MGFVGCVLNFVPTLYANYKFPAKFIWTKQPAVIGIAAGSEFGLSLNWYFYLNFMRASRACLVDLPAR